MQRRPQLISLLLLSFLHGVCDAAGRTWWIWHRTHPYSLGRILRCSPSRQDGGRRRRLRSARRRPSKHTTLFTGAQSSTAVAMCGTLAEQKEAQARCIAGCPSKAVEGEQSSLCFKACGRVIVVSCHSGN